MVKFSWDSGQLFFIIAILWSVFGFACYYFLASNTSFSRKLWRANSNLDDRVKEVVIQRGWGFFFLGILSLLIIIVVFGENPNDFGLGFNFQATPPWWSYLIIPFILIVGYFSASKPGSLALYPQMKIKDWSPGIIMLNVLSWVVFLIGYEFLFRGFLLYASLTVLEPWSAVALNCSLYALAHFYKGPGETFGAIPLGILLCYLTLYTGNIWTAVVIHIIMALSAEWNAIRVIPDVKFGRLKK